MIGLQLHNAMLCHKGRVYYIKVPHAYLLANWPSVSLLPASQPTACLPNLVHAGYYQAGRWAQVRAL